MNKKHLYIVVGLSVLQVIGLAFGMFAEDKTTGLIFFVLSYMALLAALSLIFIYSRKFKLIDILYQISALMGGLFCYIALARFWFYDDMNWVLMGVTVFFIVAWYVLTIIKKKQSAAMQNKK